MIDHNEEYYNVYVEDGTMYGQRKDERFTNSQDEIYVLEQNIKGVIRMDKFKVYVTVIEKKTGVVHMNKTIMVLDGDKKDINDLINGLTAVKQDIKENVFDPLFNKGFVQKLKDLSIEIEL